MSIIDPKWILWKTLTTAFKELEVTFPDKIDVKITKTFPKKVAELDTTRGIITIQRVSAPAEDQFLGDYQSSGVNLNGIGSDQYGIATGTLQPEYFSLDIFSLNSNYRDDLYLVLKQIMTEKRRELSENGLLEYQKVSSSDSEVAVAYLPRMVYRSTLVYRVNSLMQIVSSQDLVSNIIVSGTILTV